MIKDTGYSIVIKFKDWCGSRYFGIEKHDNDSITLDEFAHFCYDAGCAYGFTDKSMNQIINFLD